MGISGNWNRRISRRSFLGAGGMSLAALMLGSGEAFAQTREGRVGYGPTVPDPRGKLDLPESSCSPTSLTVRRTTTPEP